MGCNQSSDAQWASPTLKQNMQDAPIDGKTIEDYLELEKQIADAETSSPGLVLQQIKDQRAHLKMRTEQQKMIYQTLQQQTDIMRKNEKLADIINEDDTEEKMKDRILSLAEENSSVEARDIYAALNSKEIALQELENLKEQNDNLDKELETAEKQAKSLQELYQRQDALISRIFGGAYGSGQENELENQLDQHEEMRNRIVEANFKWKQAQLMVDYAYKQLKEAVKQWMLLPNINSQNLEERYGIACIARNNLVAASQNIQGAQGYLNTVQFPYCSPPEVATLNKATAYIFTDMQTVDRHEHALECYTITSKRCGALLQWINQVVHNTIAADLDDINKKVKESSMSLRTERVRLLQVKAKEITGEDLDITVQDINTDVKVELNLNALALTEGIDPSLLATLTANDLERLKIIADDDLAPPPSQEDIFGQVDAIKEQYVEDNEKLIHQLQENQARVQDNLNEKLRNRRQRRARKNLEEKERDALAA